MIDENTEDRRIKDVELVKLYQRFEDFLERYERDWEETARWRTEIMTLLKTHEDFLVEFRPNYKRSIWFAGMVLAGGMSYVLKKVMDHFQWR